jgi:hypothetical protein
MKPHHLAMTIMAIAASASLAEAEETATRVYRQGDSTTTITQSGSGPTMTRRTPDGPNSQTIVHQQGNNTVITTQSADEEVPEDEDLDELEGDDG